MSRWIRFAIARRVRELDIDPSLEADDQSVRLAESLYTFEKLVVLKLCRSITFDGGLSFVSEIITLLNVQYKNEKSLRKLLSGCPVLEELVLDKSYNDPMPCIYVIMSSLQRLSILNQYHDSDENTYYFFDEKVVINVPSLKYLDSVEINDYGHLCSSEVLPELVEANVKLVCESPEKLMRSITSVKRLSLCLYGPMVNKKLTMFFCDSNICYCIVLNSISLFTWSYVGVAQNGGIYLLGCSKVLLNYKFSCSTSVRSAMYVP